MKMRWLYIDLRRYQFYIYIIIKIMLDLLDQVLLLCLLPLSFWNVNFIETLKIESKAYANFQSMIYYLLVYEQEYQALQELI